jgi:hypothetical protein
MDSCFESESDSADSRRNLNDLNPNVACRCGEKGVDVLIDSVTTGTTRRRRGASMEMTIMTSRIKALDVAHWLPCTWGRNGRTMCLVAIAKNA